MSIFWPNGFWSFFFLTMLLGGGAAFMSGRAVASTWKPFGLLIFYCLLLACLVRFLHFALFESVLLSLGLLLVDFVVTVLIGMLGYRLMRVGQMVTQYRWLYQRSGVLWWRERQER